LSNRQTSPLGSEVTVTSVGQVNSQDIVRSYGASGSHVAMGPCAPVWVTVSNLKATLFLSLIYMFGKPIPIQIGHPETRFSYVSTNFK